MRVSIDLVWEIVEFIRMNVLDCQLFNIISNDFIKEFEKTERVRTTCFIRLIFSDAFMESPKYINKSESELSTLLCILQVYFSKLNNDEIQHNLIEFMENDNDNEQEYLEKAESAMKIKKCIDFFNSHSRKNEYVAKLVVTDYTENGVNTNILHLTFI